MCKYTLALVLRSKIFEFVIDVFHHILSHILDCEVGDETNGELA